MSNDITRFEDHAMQDSDWITPYFKDDDSGYPFRPRRYERHALFKDLKLTVRLDDTECSLVDFSYEGAKVTSRKVRQVSEHLRLTIGHKEHLFIDVLATVTWATTDTIGFTFGLSFDTTVLIDGLKQKIDAIRRRILIGSDLDGIFQHVPPQYAKLSSQLLHHIAVVRAKASALEPDPNEHQTRDANARRLLSECGPKFREIWHNFNDTIHGIPKNSTQHDAIKWFTERVLTSEFLGAPVVARSYTKPLGYPGDFEIMQYAYDSKQPIPKVETLADAVLHLYFAHTFGECVRARMDLVLSHIREDLKQATDSADSPFEILNLGCGGALDVERLISDSDAVAGHHMKIHLIEQGAEPLQAAFERVLPAIRRSSGHIELIPLHVSYLDIMRLGRKADYIGPQDVIYSLGLIDYFSLSQAKKYAADMWAKVKPGGKMVWCNVADKREGCEWILECLCDWRLNYRDESQMMEMFDLPGAIDVTLELEHSGQMWVISARKEV